MTAPKSARPQAANGVEVLTVAPHPDDLVVGTLLALCDNLLTLIEESGVFEDNELIDDSRNLIASLDPPARYRAAGLAVLDPITE